VLGFVLSARIVTPTVWLIFSFAFFVMTSGFAFAAVGDSGRRYRNAVRQYAENAIKYGRDTYGKKRTPLFVEILDPATHEPVKYKRGGKEWILSNLSYHQSFLRTLVGLSNLTGQPKYRQAAEQAVRYAFDHLRSPNGLLYWGGHVAYEMVADEAVFCVGKSFHHELKSHYPYYELMWEINPKATKKFIEAFWDTHILNWSKLDMNRHGDYRKKRGKLWKHQYRGGKVFFVGKGLSFCNAGSDLFYAAALLHKFTGKREPLVWAKRLARRYAETRDPKTGLGGYQYSQVKYDRARAQFGKEFGELALEGKILHCPRARIRYAVMGICQLKLGELLGQAGIEFRQWALDDLSAYGRHVYNPRNNTFVHMFSDGTELTPKNVKRSGYFGSPKSFVPYKGDPLFFWAYALAYRISEDPFHWQMARSIGRGNGLGDMGETPTSGAKCKMDTKCDDPYAVFGLLELYRRTADPAMLKLAQKVADNILKNRFRKGFFVISGKNPLANLDTLDPLALLHLAAAMQGRPDAVPEAWGPPSRGPFQGGYPHPWKAGLGRRAK